jgi:exodeoxyribonuclease X
MSIFPVIDTETTGMDPNEHALVEIGVTDVDSERKIVLPTRSSLVQPHGLIPPEAMGIHHITDEMVQNAPPASEVVPELLTYPEGTIFVAHNAQFDRGFLEPYIPGARWICTFKSALRVWPSAPNHKNQTLRYWLGIRFTPSGDPHRAGADTEVTARIFLRLLEEASIEQMLAWTLEPPLFSTCPIGRRWRGKPWADVDVSFLDWMLKQEDMEDDLKWNARHELDRRVEAARAAWRAKMTDKRAAYLVLALAAIELATSVEDLTDWFKSEKENRESNGVTKGTAEYAQIVGECAARKNELLATEQLPTTEPTYDDQPDQEDEAISAS